MFDTKHFENIAKTLYAALPTQVQQLETELEQQFKDILQSAFSHLNLVTREEFDVQVNVLSRTRDKVEALQTTLEQIYQNKRD